MHYTKIAVIGCGNLGQAIVHGLLATKSVPAEHLTATRTNIGALAELAAKGVKTTADNAAAVAEAELIVVALKPYTILPVLAELAATLDMQRHVLVSLATGVSLKQLTAVLPEGLPVYRAMPNTAADVRTSITCLCSHSTNAAATKAVKSCFDAVGTSLFIDEKLMDSATVLGACGIAYVLRFIRGMIQGGIQIGFDATTATEIVTQTVKGAAQLLIEKQQHPEQEIDKVTTPKGCTIAGLNEMEHNGFSCALIKGIVTSYKQIEV